MMKTTAARIYNPKEIVRRNRISHRNKMAVARAHGRGCSRAALSARNLGRFRLPGKGPARRPVLPNSLKLHAIEVLPKRKIDRVCRAGRPIECHAVVQCLAA